MFDRITFDPAAMGGRIRICGMRLTVTLVVNLVANGMSTEEIIREYPGLEAEDIRQAPRHARMKRWRVDHDRPSHASGWA
jgi:uncharacterized protein (DUF433 family)